MRADRFLHAHELLWVLVEKEEEEEQVETEALFAMAWMTGLLMLATAGILCCFCLYEEGGSADGVAKAVRDSYLADLLSR